MHLTTFSDFCSDYVVSLCYKHILQQLVCAFKAFWLFLEDLSEVYCGLSHKAYLL